MAIERTSFGSITIDGKTYEHDVIIRLSGEVVKRKKKLSKKITTAPRMLSRKMKQSSSLKRDASKSS
jgi:hypothetical protein